MEKTNKMCVWNTEQENTQRSKQRWKEDPALVPLFPWARAMQACSQHIHCRPKEKAKNAETKTPNINTIAPTTHQPTLQHIQTPNLRKHQDTTQFEQKPHSRTNRTSCASARTFAATLLNSVTTAKHSRTTQKMTPKKKWKKSFSTPNITTKMWEWKEHDWSLKIAHQEHVLRNLCVQTHNLIEKWNNITYVCQEPDNTKEWRKEPLQHQLELPLTCWNSLQNGQNIWCTVSFAKPISWPGMTLCWRADLKLLQTHWCHLGSRNWQS